MGGNVYFAADDGTHGRELWKSDGTEAGTQMVADLNSGGGANVNSIVAVDGSSVYFAADGGNGIEPWKTDGTEAGTVSLGNVVPARRTPREFTKVGDTVFFAARDASFHTAVFKTDGTEAGTDEVDGSPGQSQLLTAMGGKLYFSGDGELWTADADGAERVKDLVPGSTRSFPTSLAVHGGSLWITTDNGSNSSTPIAALWRSDGTEDGTTKVQSFAPSVGPTVAPGNLTSTSAGLFLTGDDGVRGNELWGTSAAASDPGAGAVPSVTCGAPALEPDPDRSARPDTGGGGTGGGGGNTDTGGGDQTPAGGGGGDQTPAGGGGQPQPGGPTGGGGTTPPVVGPSRGDIQKGMLALTGWKLGPSSLTFSQKFLVPGTANWTLTMSPRQGQGRRREDDRPRQGQQEAHQGRHLQGDDQADEGGQEGAEEGAQADAEGDDEVRAQGRLADHDERDAQGPLAGGSLAGRTPGPASGPPSARLRPRGAGSCRSGRSRARAGPADPGGSGRSRPDRWWPGAG